MTREKGLAAGWTVWNEEPDGQVILAYRPDIFDTQAFPAACLPTIIVAHGSSPDQPPERRDRTDEWYRALFLEPTVRARSVDATYKSRRAAIEGAIELTGQFVAGDINFQEVYQVPRKAYLEKLDECINQSK